MGWRQTQFPPREWWPPVTYIFGNMQIDVSTLDEFDVGIAKEVFGPNPSESLPSFIAEFGGGVSFPPTLTYENLEKERRSAPFAHHKIEFIPKLTGSEPPARHGATRLFPNNAKLLWINISQDERDL
jgi:hypothetical protein